MNRYWPWARHGKAEEEFSDETEAPASETETRGPVLRGFDFQADADTVCSFQRETYELNFPDFRYTPAFLRAFRYDLQRSSLNPDHGLFVLEEGGAVVGFIWIAIVENSWLDERYGYINNIYVAPERRGQGLAGELMRQGEKYLYARGIRELRLTVTQSNASAVALYQACGYEVERWEMSKKLQSEAES